MPTTTTVATTLRALVERSDVPEVLDESAARRFLDPRAAVVPDDTTFDGVRRRGPRPVRGHREGRSATAPTDTAPRREQEKS